MRTILSVYRLCPGLFQSVYRLRGGLSLKRDFVTVYRLYVFPTVHET